MTPDAQDAAPPPLFGVLFAEDFDEPPRPAAAPAEAVAEPEEIVPVYGVADLERAHADGLAAGRAEAQSDRARALAGAVAALGLKLQDAGPAAARVAEAAAEALARLLLAMLAAALPALCRRHAEAEVRAVMAAVLPALARQPRVQVRVHPDLIEPLAAQLRALGPELAELVVLTAAETLAPGDIRMSWQDGAAVRDTAALLAEIDDVLGVIGLALIDVPGGHDPEPDQVPDQVRDLADVD